MIECYTPGARAVGGSGANASVNDVHMVRKGTGGVPDLSLCYPPIHTAPPQKSLFASCFQIILRPHHLVTSYHKDGQVF